MVYEPVAKVRQSAGRTEPAAEYPRNEGNLANGVPNRPFLNLGVTWGPSNRPLTLLQQALTGAQERISQTRALVRLTSRKYRSCLGLEDGIESDAR